MTSFEWKLTSTTSKTITAGGVTRAFQKYAVSITKPSIATEAYTASSSTATSADATSFDYGSTVYGFVRMSTGDAAYYNLSAAGWTQVYCNGPESWYRVGAVTVTGAVSVSYTTPSLKKSTVSIIAGTDWYSAYVSTSSSATSGNASGSFEYGTTVYGFAKVLLIFESAKFFQRFFIFKFCFHKTKPQRFGFKFQFNAVAFGFINYSYPLNYAFDFVYVFQVVAI